MSKILVLLKNKKTYIALTATILIGYLLYLIQLNIGYPVTIRVLDGDNLSQNPVSLTGVMVDSDLVCSKQTISDGRLGSIKRCDESKS